MAKAFYKHRYALGIVVPDGLTAELAELRELCVLQQVLTQGSSIAIVELCCSEHSNLRKVCEVSKVPYIGVVAKGAEFWNVESCSCWASDSGRTLHVHLGCIFMHRLLVEVEVRFAISIRTQSLKRTRNGMRSSMRLVVTSNMQTHVRLSFQNDMPFGPDLRQ